MVSFNYKLFRTNRLGSYTYSQDLRQLCLCWPPIIKTTNVYKNYLWSWRLRRVLQVLVLVSGMFVFSWFLLCFCCAGWRLCWRLLTPGVPVSRYLVSGTLEPGAWSQAGCYPGHINLPSIYSVPPPARAMAVTQGESWYPILNFMAMGLCVICNLYKILVII